MFGKQKVVEGCAEGAKMQFAGGTGGEPRADRLLHSRTRRGAAARHNRRETAHAEPAWPLGDFALVVRPFCKHALLDPRKHCPHRRSAVAQRAALAVAQGNHEAKISIAAICLPSLTHPRRTAEDGDGQAAPECRLLALPGHRFESAASVCKVA